MPTDVCFSEDLAVVVESSESALDISDGFILELIATSEVAEVQEVSDGTRDFCRNEAVYSRKINLTKSS